MKVRIYLLLFLLLIAVFFGIVQTTAYSQERDVVLVPGNPPLTRLMAGKVIVLLDWALELKLTSAQEIKISEALIRAWQTNDQEDIKGVLEIIEIYEKIAPLTETERSNIRGKLREVILQSIRANPEDELARMLLSVYESAHSTTPRTSPQSNNSNSGTKSKLRVGADNFTGVYRMIRPRALNINSTRSEPGYWIEYITFLPNGYVYWTLPPEGLLYFDPVVAQKAHPNDWGTYEFKNGEIHILRGPQKQPYVITRNGERLNNPPSLGKGSFRPIPSADGLKLEGNYRRHETEPKISFTIDGRFRDGGVFRYFGTRQRPDGTIYQDDGKGGTGTYLIEQNTLELLYSDGRVKRVPFIIFPENLAKKPAVDTFILLREETMKRH